MKNSSSLTYYLKTFSSRWSQIVKKPRDGKSYNEVLEDSIDPQDSKLNAIDSNTMRSLSFIFWFAGVLVVYIGYLLFTALDLIYLIFTAFVLSMAVDQMILWFARKLKGSRGRGIFLSYFIFIGVLLSGVLIMIPFLSSQFGEIGAIWLKSVSALQTKIQSQWIGQVVEQTTRLPTIVQSFIMDSATTSGWVQGLIQDNVQQIISKGTQYIQWGAGIAVSIIGSIFSVLTQIGFVFTLAVLFSIEKDNILKLFRRIDRKHETNRHDKISTMYEKLGFWLSSQLLLSVFIFAMTWLWLLILTWFGVEIPNIFSLALIAGLTEIIPYVWPLIWSIPSILVWSINNGWIWFISVGVLFFIIQRCENNILVPWVMNKTLWVSSLLIFICMLIGASTLGFIGILLAVPIAIIISIIME